MRYPPMLLYPFVYGVDMATRWVIRHNLPRLAGHADGDDRARRDAMMQAVIALTAKSGLTASTCAALGLARASVYRARRRHLQPPPSSSARLPPPRTLR